MSVDASDEHLGALVDGELTPSEAEPWLERMRHDPALRERVAQLRLTKELVRHVYAGIEPPRPARGPARGGPAWRPAAAAAIFGFGLLAGWLARDGLAVSGGPAAVVSEAPAVHVDSGHVVVHVSTGEPEAGLAALARVQGLIDAGRDSGQAVAIEIVANGAGLDLLRAATSPHAQRLEALRATHPALTLVACGQTVQRLRSGGADVRLLPGTVTATSALDQIVLRMQQGWAYVRI